MLPIEPNDPIEPIENAEPIDPTDMNDPLQPMQRIECSDHSDHRDVLPVSLMAGCYGGGRPRATAAAGCRIYSVAASITKR